MGGSWNFIGGLISPNIFTRIYVRPGKGYTFFSLLTFVFTRLKEIRKIGIPDMKVSNKWILKTQPSDPNQIYDIIVSFPSFSSFSAAFTTTFLLCLNLLHLLNKTAISVKFAEKTILGRAVPSSGKIFYFYCQLSSQPGTI